jgi:putative protease
LKITVPISHPEEVEMLAGNGAGEFFCGFVPPEWLERYGGAFWLNRRGPVTGNLVQRDDVSLLAERSHAFGIPVHVTFNAPYYTPEQQEFLLPVIDRLARESGVDGVIVSDVGFLVALRRAFPELSVHASSVMATLNPGMVGFLEELGVRRVIFPRSLGVREIAELCGAAAGRVETEAFVLNEGCVFEEGYCMTTHRTSAPTRPAGRRTGSFHWTARAHSTAAAAGEACALMGAFGTGSGSERLREFASATDP